MVHDAAPSRLHPDARPGERSAGPGAMPNICDAARSRSPAAGCSGEGNDVPRLSIVTPAYNAQATLARMFASVARQSRRDWEHIIVVDGATDASEAVARDQAAADPRIRVMVQANAGAAAARNTGLAAAVGDYVLFLDADDTIEPGHFARMLRPLEQDRADVVCCGYVRRSTTGVRTEVYPAPKRVGHGPFRALVAEPPTAIHGVVSRRAILVEVGGFDPDLRTNEDWDLWLRVARAGSRFVPERRALASYWDNGDSLTRDGRAMVEDVQVVLQRVQHADPRVPDPLPEFAEGIELAEYEINLIACALWSAACDIARGGDGTSAIAALPGTLPYPWKHDTFSGTMIDGLMVGSNGRFRRPSQILTNWPQLAGPIQAVLDTLATRCRSPGLAQTLMRDVEADVGRLGVEGRPRMVGRTLIVPLGPATLLRRLAVPDDAEAVVMRPVLLPRHAMLTLPASPLAPLTPRALRRVVAEQAWRRTLRTASKVAAKRPVLAWPIDKAMMGVALAGRIGRRLRKSTSAGDSAGAAVPAGEPASGESSTAGWDAFFASEDPWNYASPYEQLKYRRTLELLPADRPIGRAIELACAEGMFTRMLAPRVGSLTASDISSVAIERAAARCREAGFDNVTPLLLDFFRQPIGEDWDLIVSSEVLYYMGAADELEAFAGAIEAALAPGGLFLHAHAFEVNDDPRHTGFDWEDPFGADTISARFLARPGLTRIAARRTELYLIELYQRVEPAERRAPAAPVTLPLGELEPKVAGMVVWNGAIRTRLQVVKDERTARLPVLMYHRIADHGPEDLSEWRTTPADFEHQLRFLRRRGYRSVGIEEWHGAQASSASLRGRPILITFDDAYVDFRRHAWPILERNGFTAHVFVPTAKVGLSADWDADLGEPAPIMDWDEITTLHRAGVSFGSHLATHRAADQMSARELFDEASASKAALEQRLGEPVTSVAPPFGAMNLRVEQVLRDAGYIDIFDAQGGIAPVWGSRWRIPRVDIAGYDTIEDFAAKVGNTHEPPEAADRP